MTSVPAPAEVFAAGVSERRLRYQRCDDCGRAVFYPRVLCPFCGSLSLRWLDSGGRGSIYAQTWVATRDGGYSVALIDLDEGFRMMSSVLGAEPGLIRSGLRVVTDYDVVDRAPRVVFLLDGGQP